jgi:hypothetical protein
MTVDAALMGYEGFQARGLNIFCHVMEDVGSDRLETG